MTSYKLIARKTNSANISRAPHKLSDPNPRNDRPRKPRLNFMVYARLSNGLIMGFNNSTIAARHETTVEIVPIKQVRQLIADGKAVDTAYGLVELPTITNQE